MNRLRQRPAILAAEALWILSDWNMRNKKEQLGIDQRKEILSKYPLHKRWHQASTWLVNFYLAKLDFTQARQI